MISKQDLADDHQIVTVFLKLSVIMGARQVKPNSYRMILSAKRLTTPNKLAIMDKEFKVSMSRN